MRAVDAQAVVLVPGAYDRVLPFPGWELPGVYSAGAAQALAKGQRIGIGRRVLVAGTGPFLLPVAESLLGVGAEVVGLLEANRLSTILRGWLTDPMVAKGKLKEAFGYAALLARHGLPIGHGRTVIAAHGQDRVEAVTTAKLDKAWQPIPGSEQRVEVDAVCLGFGFTAQLELAVAAGCELGESPDGGPAAVVGADQQTSIPGVFAAGELTGIGGADLAAAEGRVAGAAAAAFLTSAGNSSGRAPGAGNSSGRSPRTVDPAAVVAAQGEVAQGRRFATALAKAYPVQPGWQSWSDPSTLICRCEEVSRGEIEDAVSGRDVSSMRSLKLTSRAGLGLCQGRICARTTAELACARQAAEQAAADPPGERAATDRPVGSAAGRTVVRAEHNRPLAQPVRLKDLADIQEEQ
jgi:NADPH-dependent 2,4-dienoyl-CoA reductase/sulfur reductase-like enzyme